MSQTPSAFLETIIASLLPYFAPAAANLDEARIEIIETLAEYGTRTRGEMLLAAQVIALGMTTIDVLANARAAELSLSQRTRCAGCGNALNRSGLRTQAYLDQRLAAKVPPAEGEDLQRAGPPHARANTGTNNGHLWAGAMIDTLREMGIPLDTAPGQPVQSG
jgi:hypothetical protein